jgi:hypothetical protein
MRVFKIITLLWISLLVLGFNATTAQSEKAPLGTNLAGIASWNPAWQFMDVFRTARPWISQCTGCNWGEGGTLDLSPEGWVMSLQEGQYAETIMLDGGVYPEGNYILTYEGEGQIVFSLDSATITANERGRIVFTINGENGIWLQIVSVNPDDYIRNIHIYMPTDAETTFHPQFLERLQGFTTLRFMDWMATNNSPIVTWDDRPKMTDAQWHEFGVPVEIMVLLANSLQADAWFNMPHRADDDYIRQFASYVRDNLNPDLKAYIEYSNETWNSQFEQAHYVIEQGKALGLSDNDFQAGLFYHSHRAGEIFAIWEDVFGGTDRLVRVLASQGANSWTGEQVLTYNNMYEHADALAIAPYFGGYLGDPSTIEDVLALGIDGVLDASLAHIQGEVRGWINDNLRVTSQYGVELVAYEGGQHLTGYAGAENDDRLTELFIAVNRDARIGDLYMEYLTQWDELGGGLFVNFSDISEPSKWGSWGVLEYQTQPRENAPKYDALLDFMGK